MDVRLVHTDDGKDNNNMGLNTVDSKQQIEGV